ncbi:MAG TPA: alpha-amylase/4-alpha-glucanotransferase domain-containing protein [Gemmatimonadaceae bacterium]|nr:alpha-amylase/4-alpha-glucanotransferase domain-containing protein [Gemmatimonadaceae bacterium]
MSAPVRFVFGVHLHQPVGNFDHVFADHVRDVYAPLLAALTEREFFPVTLHISGPLLEWLEQHEPAYVDQVGRLAADGRLELLMAGYYEPVLASLPRDDRLEQLAWMREALRARFGVQANGLWLTERVWEPDLAADLHDAGVRFALVDDRHFLVSGFRPDQLHAPWWTEHGGKRLALLPISERLRYLIPFQPPEETIGHLEWLRANGHQLAILADDGEKFGGWPGTREWVYEKGWFNRFFDAMHSAIDRGDVVMSTCAAAVDEVPTEGPAYLPTASYREMEEWSLPAEAALRLHALERELGADRLAGVDGALIRGSHWRNFQAKYAESNRMHKKMLAVTRLCRERGNPDVARRHVGRAQCNDAYWHGVFGGLYLPFLRAVVWKELAEAERLLRAGDAIAADVLDLDFDGHDDIWIHSATMSLIVSPWRGGSIEEFTNFADGVNLADTLTRRRESYHRLAGDAHDAADGEGDDSDESTPSIHDIERQNRMQALPPVDHDVRALFVDRVLPPGLPFEVYERAEYAAVHSWSRAPLRWTIDSDGEGDGEPTRRVRVTMHDDSGFEKIITLHDDGVLRVDYRWDASVFPADAIFAPELSCAREVDVRVEVAGDREVVVWRHPIETIAKSEKGLERTVQGISITPCIPVRAGSATVIVSVGTSSGTGTAD